MFSRIKQFGDFLLLYLLGLRLEAISVLKDYISCHGVKLNKKMPKIAPAKFLLKRLKYISLPIARKLIMYIIVIINL